MNRLIDWLRRRRRLEGEQEQVHNEAHRIDTNDPVHLTAVATDLADRYAATGDRRLLDEAVALQRRAVKATPESNPDFASQLNNLAVHLGNLYAATGDRGVLDEVVALQRRAVEATPKTSTQLPAVLTNLARHLAILYGATGDRRVLDEAIALQRRAVEATPKTSTQRPAVLTNLAVHLGNLYAATGDRRVLDEVVALQRRAVKATPETSTQRPVFVNNLASHLTVLYAATGDRRVLDEAIALQRRAVEATRETSTDYPRHLHTLARCLAELFAATGDRRLLDEAVAVQRRAVEATPETSVDYPRRLSNLVSHLADLFAVTGDHRLLDEAVPLQRRAVAATPETSTDYPRFLDALATRLVTAYDVTGDRRLIDEAVATQRHAVEATPETSTHLPRHLNNLVHHLADLHDATGDHRLLDEAVALQRRAVAATSEISTDYPRYLDSLAIRLGGLYGGTGDRRLIDEAVALHRRAVEATLETSTHLPRHLNNLATGITGLYLATGDRRLLNEAIATQRRAVEATPETSSDFAHHLHSLANRLADLFAVTGDRRLLDQAWELVVGLTGGGPVERARFAETRARLVRTDERRGNRYAVAAQELTAAFDAFRDELARPELSLSERRDLSQRTDGLLGDLITSHILAGDANRAIDLLEGARMWLGAPGQPAQESPEPPPIAVAWVATSQWETTVVTTLDHRNLRTPNIHVVRTTSRQIRTAVADALNSAHMDPGVPAENLSLAAQQRRVATDALCNLTSEIAAAFPQVHRLLVIPLGICALLPYAAATHPDGGMLIDHTTLTIAPSLAWARTAHRARVHGRSIGAFHPGKLATRPLDLRGDRNAFKEIVGGEVLDQPTAEQVIARFETHTDIGHFSCHGAYNPVKPLDSCLDLETDLTIQAVLDHTTAPWLVNLSACDTAIPDLQAVEQHISFPTGFLRGGAAHVLATLWPVSNNYATAVNRAFYQNLTADQHPADALRNAVQYLRGASDTQSSADPSRDLVAARDQPASIPFDHPYWWAPFTHHGSPW